MRKVSIFCDDCGSLHQPFEEGQTEEKINQLLAESKWYQDGKQYYCHLCMHRFILNYKEGKV